MTNYLVTGGAGFIGSSITERLVQQGHSVTVLDNLSTGKSENMDGFRDQIRFVQGDVSDPEATALAMEGAEVVFHQAALASVPLSVEKPKEVNRACVDGTLNVLEQARRCKVRRVVYAGSSSCYGDQPYAANRETDAIQPLSPYAVAKLGGEMYCRAYYETFGLETVTLRYFNVFGPRQDPESVYSAVIPIFISRILRGEAPVIYGDGEQSRDFTYIENVIQGNLLAAEHPAAAGRCFNMANGRSTTLNQLMAALNHSLGADVQPIYEAARPGDIRDSMADISLAHRVLGYQPAVDLQEGLDRSIQYYRSVVTA